jgi:hypothetical protein
MKDSDSIVSSHSISLLGVYASVTFTYTAFAVLSCPHMRLVRIDSTYVRVLLPVLITETEGKYDFARKAMVSSAANNSNAARQSGVTARDSNRMNRIVWVFTS